MTELDKSLSERAAKIRDLRAKAKRARDHAARLDDTMAADNLNRYAAGLEADAANLQAEEDKPSPNAVPEPSGEPSSVNATLALKPQEPYKS